MSRLNTSWFGHVLPVVHWAKHYRSKDLRFDLLAGATLAAFAIPESLAYASLAGLEPEVGLYAGIAAMLVYALLGSSRLLGFGVTSALAVLVAGTIGPLAGGDGAKAAVMAALATMIAGAAAVVGWICRLGFLANLVSSSVLKGFSAGAGIFIASTQLSKLFGVKGSEGEFFARMSSFFQQVQNAHWLTLAVGVTALALLVLGGRFAPRLPIPLMVVAVALMVAPLANLPQQGVEVVGKIPSGLPTPSFPGDALSAWQTLIPLGLSVFVLSYVEGVAAARSLAASHGGHVDPNQEMLACGVANLASGFFRGMPVGGSLTRSSVNAEAGARTQLAGAVGGGVLVVVVAFLAGLFANLPEAVLAAIILMAVADLVDVRALVRIFQLSKREFIIAMLTGGGVLLFGMLWGIIIGVAVSLLDLLERMVFPHTAELGRIPHTPAFGDREQHPEYEPVPDTLIVRLDASLVFANAHQVKQDILKRVHQHDAPVCLLVLDLEAAPTVDLSGAGMLEELADTLEAEGIEVRIAGARAAQRRLLRASSPHRFRRLEPATNVGRVVQTWRERTGTSPH